MGTIKSLDELKLIAALLYDVQTLHSEVYTPRDMRLDTEMVFRRTSREGISFLTKALPRLAKSLERALTGEVSLDSTGFRKKTGSKLPKFLGSLFESVFTQDGWVLPHPSVTSIKDIRQVLLVFYKYALPYSHEDEHEVVDQFVKSDNDILIHSQALSQIAEVLASSNRPLSRQSCDHLRGPVIRGARIRLARLFASFDPGDITPSHGPGAVSTRERLWAKMTFRCVSPRIAQTYPLDAFFFASLGHVCDNVDGLMAIEETESSARVVLVPKDSRGPRLISCEPLDFQWIQQGLSRAIVKHVESHPLTRWNVNFTNQQPNQFGALLGSETGRYASLDLKEASDRVSVGLVRLLFPEPLLEALMNTRSLSTELPSGQIRTLNKFAPMGSALCFPIMALTIWALLSAGAPDADTREGILVYGDDVIVPTAYAENAIEVLEEFGLIVNRSKSFTRGFFRESCGVDAFRGVNVTPVKLKTVWSSHRCPHVYTSWIAYANSMFSRGYRMSYEVITSRLFEVYGEIPSSTSFKDVPALISVPSIHEPKKRRSNAELQKVQWRVWTISSRPIVHEIDGWKMLLRYFTEAQRPSSREWDGTCRRSESVLDLPEPFDVRSYTKRDSVKLQKRWR